MSQNQVSLPAEQAQQPQDQSEFTPIEIPEITETIEKLEQVQVPKGRYYCVCGSKYPEDCYAGPPVWRGEDG